MNYNTRSKIVHIDDLHARRTCWDKYKKIGLAHGCFDVLTPAHIRFLMDSACLCDILIVSVSSDEVARRLKGVDRPVFSLEDRIMHVASLEFVDYAIACHDEDAGSIIKHLSPISLLKGHDSVESTAPGFVREKTAANQSGGEVVYVVAGAQNHTSGLIEALGHKYLSSCLPE
jgi:rfaE bifunctional protein nucleotidyltransferase chain/domain